MARSQVRITPYGEKKILESGIYNTFINFALKDELQMYNVLAENDLIDAVGSKTGTHRPYTDSISCGKNFIPPISVGDLTDEEFNREKRRAVFNLEYTNCDNPYLKQNLVVNIDLAEYFEYLYNLPNTDYSRDTKVSLTIYDSVYYNLQEKNSEGIYENIDSSEKFIPSLSMLPGTLENLAKVTSRWSTINGSLIKYTDRALERFWNPLLFNIQPSSIAGSFVEGQQLFITPFYGTMGAVVNGNLNYVSLDTLGSVESYDTVKPAVRINNSTNGIYWMVNAEKTYKILDENKTGGQMVWNFINEEGKYLIQGLVDLMRNSVEYKFEETSFGVYETKLELQYILDARTSNTVSDTIGGGVTINFIYDSNKVVSIPNYNNIINIA